MNCSWSQIFSRCFAAFNSCLVLVSDFVEFTPGHGQIKVLGGRVRHLWLRWRRGVKVPTTYGGGEAKRDTLFVFVLKGKLKGNQPFARILYFGETPTSEVNMSPVRSNRIAYCPRVGLTLKYLRVALGRSVPCTVVLFLMLALSLLSNSVRGNVRQLQLQPSPGRALAQAL